MVHALKLGGIRLCIALTGIPLITYWLEPNSGWARTFKSKCIA